MEVRLAHFVPKAGVPLPVGRQAVAERLPFLLSLFLLVIQRPQADQM